MELRHLRYFIAVAEEGGLTVAAERRLFVAQPSLSRQIRGLEEELGTDLLIRGARGVELTAAGRVFLDHARIALLQVEAAAEAARHAARPPKASFVVGFLTGYEMEWLPALMSILREELPNIEVVVRSEQSPDLANALVRGKLDVAFLRREERASGLVYKLLPRGVGRSHGGESQAGVAQDDPTERPPSRDPGRRAQLEFPRAARGD
jgi:LysR family hca operon transcriptional activator